MSPPKISPIKYTLSLLFLITHLSAAPSEIQSFLSTYCLDCHGPEKQKADRRYDQLTFPVTDPDNLILLKDALDQIILGEMPPKKAPQPSQDEQETIIEQLQTAFTQGRDSLSAAHAPGSLRRLNHREYLNTIADLFQINTAAFNPTLDFPRDETEHHFDTIGSALRTSGFLLDHYLDAADAIVEKALRYRNRPQPEPQTWHFKKDFYQQPELRYSHDKVFKHRYLCVYECMDSENHEGGYAPIQGFEQGVPHDGHYEIRVLAHALHQDHPYDPDIFGIDTRIPFRLGIVPGDHTVGLLHHPQPLQPLLAEKVIPAGEPQWHSFTVWLDAGHTPRFVFPNGMRNCRQAFAKIAKDYKHLWPKDDPYTGGIVDARRVVLQHGQMPHIRIHEIEIRGPLYQTWPPASVTTTLGAPTLTAKDQPESLRRFLTRAYRRPPTEAELARLQPLIKSELAAGKGAIDSLKPALKAALCSPAFLYHAKTTQPQDPKASHPPALDPYALANRLAYFLWSSPPDDQLFAAAADASILQPDILRQQTRRLLAHPKSDHFIAGFLDSWLNLRSLGDMPPDRSTFSAFYTHNLQHGFKQETRLFLKHLITTNSPLTHLLDSDYSFLNQPLADLYGLGPIAPPEKAHEFQKISFPSPKRGGLLGHGSILTVSANGIETSPVVRGVWMLENFLGTPPPPPPDDVPPIDPDVRGSTSIRDQLVKHREDPNCYGCHQKIDPLGFALENYDPIGQWRSHYSKKLAIDPAGELPNGQAFADISELKKLLLERQDSFITMLTGRLLTYATGRRMTALEADQIAAIAQSQKDQNYPTRSLLEALIQSPLFQNP